MADITEVLSSSRFRPTNIKVLLLLFTEYPFSLPSRTGNTFVIGFMFYPGGGGDTPANFGKGCAAKVREP